MEKVRVSQTVFTVADDVYDDVALECLAPLCSQPAHTSNCFDIVAVYVEHRRLKSMIKRPGTSTSNEQMRSSMNNQNVLHLYGLGDVSAVGGRA